MTNPTAYLEWSLHVYCPKCEQSNDLAGPEHDSEQEISGHIFKSTWDKLEGWEVTCQHCGHEFKIEEVVY